MHKNTKISGLLAVSGWLAFVIVSAISSSACACISIADNQDQARKEVRYFLTIAKSYEAANQTQATSIDELLQFQASTSPVGDTAIPKDALDPWGNPYQFSIISGLFGQSVKITSFGNDGRSGGWLKNKDISG